MKRILAALAALTIAFSGIAAYALNIDPNKQVSARILSTQQVHYYRATVNFNDANISGGVKFGRLPANAYITAVQVEVVTAFNAVTTNVLTFGTTSTATELVAAGDVDEATAAIYNVSRGLGRSLAATADTDLYAKYTQTGTAASAGKAVFIITYIPDNDQ